MEGGGGGELEEEIVEVGRRNPLRRWRVEKGGERMRFIRGDNN